MNAQPRPQGHTSIQASTHSPGQANAQPQPQSQSQIRPLARRNLWRIYLLEAKYEALKAARLPGFLLPLFCFPLIFYVIFGVALNRQATGGYDMSSYLLATYGALGIMNAGIYGFGVVLAAERGQGWMLFKRATPMPMLANLTGRLAMSALFGALVVGALFVLGASVGGVRLPAATWAELGGTLVAGALPFAAFGLAIGWWAGPSSAAAVVNLLALPMALVSGMWLPIEILPKLMRQAAHFLPGYYTSQLALKVIGRGGREPAALCVAFLVGFTALALALAWVGARRDEGRTYG